MTYYPPKKQFDLERIMREDIDSSNSRYTKKERKKKLPLRKMTAVLGVFILAVIISGGYFAYKTSSTFDKVTGEQNSFVKSIIMMLPLSDKFFQILPVEGDEGSVMDRLKNNKLERLNILLLGIRGVNDPNGGLLTDTLMIMSVKPQTGEVALISIPRDLFVEMLYSDHKNKINEAYALGIKNDQHWKGGLKYSKEAIADVTGLDIHYVASIDFEAFKEIINTLGGITITLNKPFLETDQFAEGVIELPAGRQVIDGDTALLFVRARFSSSDFDRARRQQQVLLAVKEKAFSLGVVSNPIKIISILNSIGNHVRTDMELWEIQEIALMSNRIDTSNMKRKVFSTGKDGLLYASRDSKGSYILLPEGGSFDKIREVCQGIFD
ncbi:MAG: LCP family protein [Patescibacteria group bacterium]|nr:LCP family protein [Patescibacteria group bacterium]